MKKTAQREVLPTSKIVNFANPGMINHRLNSGVTPRAQSSKLLQIRDNIEPTIIQIENIIGEKSKETLIHKAIIELMYMHGLRISEVCKIRGTDVNRSGHIHIKGSKGSHNRYVSPGRYIEFWKGIRSNPQSIGSTYSRHYWYRLFKKLGLSINTASQHRKAVTHSLRHIYLQEGIRTDEDKLTLQRSIGHKNQKSTEHYIKQKRQSTSQSKEIDNTRKDNPRRKTKK
ncbi:MAG: tyrosine-type recombinase/integrase [Bacteroidota bacterium]